MSPERPIYKLRGHLGILAEKIRPEVKAGLKKKLRLYLRGWKDEPPTEVIAYHDDGEYFWVPRFFFAEATEHSAMGSHRVQMDWTDGLPQQLSMAGRFVLDAARGQPLAVEKMAAYLRQHSGGMLVAPTGFGKTGVAYAIAELFKTSIGVLVYNGHMMKNWIQTAKDVFGLTDDQVGIVQGDRCDLGRPITIMMIESLLTRNYPSEIFDQIGFLIFDEVHRCAPPMWGKTLRLFPARYRLGMSADPHRTDGLGPLVSWHFGRVGHSATISSTAKPDVIQIRYRVSYAISAYSSWNGALNNGDGGWEPDPISYDRLLQNDKGRNRLIVDELVKARATGRRILIFARTLKHLERLRIDFEKSYKASLVDMVVDESIESGDAQRRLDTKVTMLVGGLKTAKLADAMTGDVMFTTTAFAREALNVPHIDTLVFATPPGKPLQPIGRLRDKGPADRRPLLALDIYEDNDYARSRASRRADVYKQLGIKVSMTDRNQIHIKSRSAREEN